MRNRYFLLFDLLLLGPLPFAVLAVRLESTAWPPGLAQVVATYAAFALITRIGLIASAGLYRFIWRHASVVELERLVYVGLAAGVLTFLTGWFVLPGLGLIPLHMPLSALLLDAIAAVGLMAAPRLAYRLYGQHATDAPRAGAKRILVAGAGALGQAVLRATRDRGGLAFDPVAFVDDDPQKRGQLLGGVPVLGTIADIADLARRLGVEEVIIAIPSARGSVVRRILEQSTAAGVPTRVVPGMDDLISGRVHIQSLRKVSIHDLLRREPITTDLVAVRALATGRAVLVTGAGGSIGSELSRQIADLGPSLLVILDHSENQVFEIDIELRKRNPSVAIKSVIADIREATRIRALFDEVRPFAVFHAAAHKHVPLMEGNLVEAVTNNILGTRNVVDAALDAGTEHLVLISTDKAVRPTSIMGVTKRIAEQIVQEAATAEHRNFVSVRFGNVLASRGSVVPTFLRQIEEGGPVTVTHPEMRRYFMTIPEAVQLVLQASVLGKGGELFVLDMGEPVKIVDLARDLIRLSGLDEGHDIEIKYTGVRPGEKLFEEVLFGNEDVHSTEHPKILMSSSAPAPTNFSQSVDTLIQMVSIIPHGDAAVRDLLRAVVPDFAHEDARTNPRNRPSPYPAGQPKPGPTLRRHQ